jgi:hypothetical protein
MKKLTWQEMEDIDSMGDIWIEEEKIRLSEEAQFKVSEKGTESL